MKKINSLVGVEFLSKFPSGFPDEIGYIGYISNLVNLEQFLACAAFLSPDFIEHRGSIFLARNVNNLSTRFGCDKKAVEQYNNMICLSDLFQSKEGAYDDELIVKAGEVLMYYWKSRLEYAFPDKKFAFLLKEGLFDEDGLCITFFEED